MTSVIVSGLGPYPWDGSQVGPVTGWAFLQALLHFCPCRSFRQEQFWVKFSEDRWVAPSLHWRWSLQVPSPYCWAFWLRSSPLSLRSLLHPSSLVFSRGSPDPDPTPQSCIFLLAPWASLLSNPILDPVPHFPSLSHLHCFPSASHDYFVPPSKWD